MTTKQEIIDHVKNNLVLEYTHSRELIQMIKDLKPEIKIKKLVWAKGSYRRELVSNAKGFILHESLTAYRIEKEGGILPKCYTLQEAKDHVQQLWDEYVLSLVEVDDENQASL